MWKLWQLLILDRLPLLLPSTVRWLLQLQLLHLTRLLLLCLNLLLLVWVGLSRRSQGKDLPKITTAAKLVTVPLLQRLSHR